MQLLSVQQEDEKRALKKIVILVDCTQFLRYHYVIEIHYVIENQSTFRAPNLFDPAFFAARFFSISAFRAFNLASRSAFFCA